MLFTDRDMCFHYWDIDFFWSQSILNGPFPKFCNKTAMLCKLFNLENVWSHLHNMVPLDINVLPSFIVSCAWINQIIISSFSKLSVYKRSIQRCPTKKVLLKILKNSQENTFAGVCKFFFRLALLLKSNSSTGVLLLILRNFIGQTKSRKNTGVFKPIQYCQDKIYFFQLGYTPCKAEQPLQGTELQEKQAQKD